MLPVVGENLAQSRAETASLLMASLIIDNAEPFAALLGTIALHDLCSARAKCSRVLHARIVPSEPLFIAICELHRDGLDGTQVVR